MLSAVIIQLFETVVGKKGVSRKPIERCVMVIVKSRLLSFSVSPRLVYDDNKKTEIQQNIYMTYNTCLATSSNRYHFRCSWLFFQCRTKRSVA